MSFSRSTGILQQAGRATRPNTFLVKRLYSAASTSIAHEEFDIVIVGGGPAGLALANALGSSKPIQESSRVLLVEAGDLSKIHAWNLPQNAYSNRVSSITNSSRQFLADTSAWDHVDVQRTAPIESMEVWDGISDARISFLNTDLGSAGRNGMSTLIENLNLQRGLLRALEKAPSVELTDKVKVAHIAREERDGGGWPLLHLSNGRTLRARLLIGADGFNSPVRQYAQIDSYGWSYDTQGVVATLHHASRSPLQSPNTTAYQRFLPTGPIAFLPLSPTISSLVWSTRPAIAEALKACELEVLALMVNAAFRLPSVSMAYVHKRLLEAHASGEPLTTAQVQAEIAFRECSHGIDSTSALSTIAATRQGVPPVDSELYPPLVNAIQPGTIASFPLRYQHADAYIGEGPGARTVLVGDAAHTMHPLAGQGLNTGIGDVEALAKCVQSTIITGGDIGSRTALLPYTRARYFENHKLMSAVDKLHKLYSSTATPVVWARSTGLEILNELDTLKAALMLSAGAEPRVHSRTMGQSLSVFAAGAVKGVAEVVSSAKTAVGMAQGVVGVGLQELGKVITGQRRA